MRMIKLARFIPLWVTIGLLIQLAPRLFLTDLSTITNCSSTKGSQFCDEIRTAVADVREPQPNFTEIKTDPQSWINCSSTKVSQLCDEIRTTVADVREPQPNFTEIKTDPQSWITPFIGSGLETFRSRIDTKIRHNVKKLEKHKNTCKVPTYIGEYGYELAAMVPWAYSKINDCKVKTKGVVGTKYLYFFSDHTVDSNLTRKPRKLPHDHPFGKRPHFDDTQFQEKTKGGVWVAPPFKNFYRRDDIELDKPLVIISNKYAKEWEFEGPVNFIPVNILREVLEHLTPNYNVVYSRFQDKRLEDSREYRNSDRLRGVFKDKEMIRKEFPSVVLFDELSQGLPPDSVNLLLFSLSSMSDNFLSVQGGNSVVASFFGGRNIILTVFGPEIPEKRNDYSYYHRFSNATIDVARNGTKFLELVKTSM
jgi:hypothetical protein